jgi:mRNA interferase RelE/StbE
MPISPSGSPVHRLLLGPRAQKDLDRLIGDTWVRVREGLRILAPTPRPKGCIKFSTGAWRIRVDGFRVLYDVDDKARTVEVLRIKHQRESYRGL